MNQTDLAFAPALTQAQLIRTGQLSPLELTQLYLERIQTYDSKLGSFVTVTAEQAMAEAAAKTEWLTSQPEQLPPFFGVPIAIKDLTAVAGVRCMYGSPAMADHISAEDDAVVARLKRAGFIILGKTAVSELGSLPYSEPMGMPPARNPWNLDYTAGGSSGGAAAAVAAGLSPIAQGSDGGGSVRGPAFCCGLVGLKPARGRISAAPVGDYQSGIATNGVLARTVTDAAALLDVMAGYVTGDPYWLSDPPQSFLAAAQAEPHSCRIAYSTEIAPIGKADADCAEAVLTSARQLANLGHQLEPACPDFAGLVEPFLVVWRAGVSAAGLPPEALSPFNAWLLSQPDSSGDYLRAVNAMQVLSRKIIAFFESYEALLLPVYLHPAIRVGEWANLPPADTLQQIIHWIAPCPPANASGQPAITLPTGLATGSATQGLPVGVQLIGRPADEATILALAAQLATAASWQQRPEFALS